MSFFPRFPASEFGPLFRLLDDFDVHRSTRDSQVSSIRAFQPKFDVREIKDAYELQGELPGLNQKDVSLEFTDAHTLVIKGHTERNITSGTPPAAVLEEAHTKAITDAESDSSSSYHKATVEDEGAATDTTSTVGADTPASTPAQTQQVSKVTKQADEDDARYWVSERSVGEFHRSFNFPSRVDQDAVKASLKNGILSIVVPKSSAPISKRINIE
ncbi:MAG: hypothetical protein M1812_000506 [Candelaria pacifica]|nr:MAG: hypothetical protein M1812_000506 [Candelaria pacifica]